MEANQSNFHTAKKDLGLLATTGIKYLQGLVLRYIICDTLTAPNLSLHRGFKLPESKLLIHVTDKIELPFASLLLKYFNSFINLTILLQDAAISPSEEVLSKILTVLTFVI